MCPLWGGGRGGPYQREILGVDPDDAEFGVRGVVPRHLLEGLQELEAVCGGGEMGPWDGGYGDTGQGMGTQGRETGWGCGDMEWDGGVGTRG